MLSCLYAHMTTANHIRDVNKDVNKDVVNGKCTEPLLQLYDLSYGAVNCISSVAVLYIQYSMYMRET